MAVNPPPEVLARYGALVRELRNDAGLTLDALSSRVPASKTRLSNLENGKAKPNAQLRDALDDVIGHGQLARLWSELTGEARQEWLDEVARAIRDSVAVYDYQALTFPSYMQTERYAESLVRAAAPWAPPQELKRRVQERLERAKQMRNSLRPMLWLVIDGTVLRRRYGGGAAAREQLEYVTDLAEAGRVTLQVVPEDIPDHPGNSGTFRVLTMHDGTEMGYVESAARGQMLPGHGAVARRRALFAALQAVAHDPRTSTDMLKSEIDRIAP